MDLGLYFRTLWRYKPLMLYGFFVAVFLAFLSAARITTHGIEQRGTTTWSSTATLLITSAQDFPYGRTAPAYLPADPRKGIPSVQVSDPNQLTTFALLYSLSLRGDPLVPVGALLVRVAHSEHVGLPEPRADQLQAER